MPVVTSLYLHTRLPSEQNLGCWLLIKECFWTTNLQRQRNNTTCRTNAHIRKYNDGPAPRCFRACPAQSKPPGRAGSDSYIGAGQARTAGVRRKNTGGIAETLVLERVLATQPPHSDQVSPNTWPWRTGVGLLISDCWLAHLIHSECRLHQWPGLGVLALADTAGSNRGGQLLR